MNIVFRVERSRFHLGEARESQSSAKAREKVLSQMRA